MDRVEDNDLEFTRLCSGVEIRQLTPGEGFKFKSVWEWIHGRTRERQRVEREK